MSSLTSNFKEVMEKIKMGREYTHASFDPVYYLIFSPAQILEVKRTLPVWISSLKNSGWQVHTFSVANEIHNLINSAPLKDTWLKGDSKTPLEWNKTNSSLSNFLRKGGLHNKLENTLEMLGHDSKNILFITDLEALHPYLRIGAIETELQGKFKSPTIFLYPGVRKGKSSLKFLGFYPEDGNYRSVHVGG